MSGQPVVGTAIRRSRRSAALKQSTKNMIELRLADRDSIEQDREEKMRDSKVFNNSMVTLLRFDQKIHINAQSRSCAHELKDKQDALEIEIRSVEAQYAREYKTVADEKDKARKMVVVEAAKVKKDLSMAPLRSKKENLQKQQQQFEGSKGKAMALGHAQTKRRPKAVVLAGLAVSVHAFDRINDISARRH
jgi:hypothetical protein